MQWLDHGLAIDHYRPNPAHYFYWVLAFQISGLWKNHVGVPGGVAHLNINHSDEIHLLQHLNRLRLVRQSIHGVLLVNHPSLDWIRSARQNVFPKLEISAVTLGRHREILVDLINARSDGVIPREEVK